MHNMYNGIALLFIFYYIYIHYFYLQSKKYKKYTKHEMYNDVKVMCMLLNHLYFIKKI